MKRILFCLVVLALVAGSANAAEISTTAGSKALVFQFSGLSNLGLSGYGGGIGARWYMSDGMALRPGLNVSFASNKTKGLTGYTDDKNTSHDIGLSLAVEKHVTGPKSISPYLGAGASFDMVSHAIEPSVSTNPPAGTRIKTTNSGTSVGVFLLGGFEWGFTESLTLGGEYRAGFSYGTGKVEVENQGEPKVKSNETTNLGLGLSTASVYLSASF